MFQEAMLLPLLVTSLVLVRDSNGILRSCFRAMPPPPGSSFDSFPQKNLKLFISSVEGESQEATVFASVSLGTFQLESKKFCLFCFIYFFTCLNSQAEKSFF